MIFRASQQAPRVEFGQQGFRETLSALSSERRSTFKPSPAVPRTVDRRRESERRDEYCADGSTRDPTCK